MPFVDILPADGCMAETRPMRRSLVCVECEREADEDAVGWRGYLVDSDEGEDEVVFFCPLCAAREFSAK
jgi:hypothetical protein